MKVQVIHLLKAPEGIGTTLYKAWGALFSCYGFSTFNSLEARGVLMHTLACDRETADKILGTLVEMLYAEVTG